MSDDDERPRYLVQRGKLRHGKPPARDDLAILAIPNRDVERIYLMLEEAAAGLPDGELRTRTLDTAAWVRLELEVWRRM